MTSAKSSAMARPLKSKKPTAEPPGESTDLAPVVGKNLKRLRTERGLSLERLAQSSGVSRAMLGQVELGQSAPTINVLWKMARALDVPFSALEILSHHRGEIGRLPGRLSGGLFRLRHSGCT